MKTLFDWSPLGLILKHWEPITGFFKGLWDKLKPIIEPMMKFLGFSSDGDGVIKGATDKVNAWTEEQNARNEQAQAGQGRLVKPIAPMPQLLPEATTVASMMRAPANDARLPLMAVPSVPASAVQSAAAAQSLAKPAPVPVTTKAETLARDAARGRPLPGATPGGSLPTARGSLVQQTAAASKTELQGSMVVRFDNAPPGMVVNPAQTNQPGLSVTPSVGYRSLGRTG